jgi:protein O-mannosyl-transferase
MPRKDSRHSSSSRAGETSPPAPPRPWLVQAGALALLAAASSVAYLNADHKELFFDSLMLSDRTEIRTVSDSLLRFLRNPLLPGEELTYITFSINHAVNRGLGLPGLDVTAFLVVNVCIHALNTCLVYLLLRALLRQIEPDRPPRTALPLALAALFAVHPLHAASVVYIIQRRGLMAVTFYLAALLAYLRFRAARRPRMGPLLAVVLFYWLSFKSKSMGLTLPLAVLALEFCLRAPDPRAAKRFLVWLVPGVLLCVLGMFLFLWKQNLFDPAEFGIRPLSKAQLWGPWPHFLTESRVFVQYWKLILLPLPHWLCLDHGFDVSHRLTQHGAWLAVLFHGLLIGAAVVAAMKKYTVGAFGVLLFYISLIPWAVLPQRELFVEYKTYLSAIGVVLVLAEFARHVRVSVVLPVAAIAAGLLLNTTIRRNAVFKSPLSIWSDVVAKYPDHFRGQANLAATLKQSGRLEESIQHGREAVRLAPQFAEARNTLGVSLADAGRIEEAMQEYRTTLQIDPQSVDAHYNLGNALQTLRRFSEAVEEYRQAEALAQDRLQSYIMCANALTELGRVDDAISELRTGLLAARPNENPAELARAHFNLANTYARTGLFDLAVGEYRAAVELNPRHVNACYGLGMSLQKQGRPEEAVKAYSDALLLDPGHVAARSALESLRAKPDRPSLPESPP